MDAIRVSVKTLEHVARQLVGVPVTVEVVDSHYAGEYSGAGSPDGGYRWRIQLDPSLFDQNRERLEHEFLKCVGQVAAGDVQGLAPWKWERFAREHRGDLTRFTGGKSLWAFSTGGPFESPDSVADAIRQARAAIRLGQLDQAEALTRKARALKAII